MKSPFPLWLHHLACEGRENHLYTSLYAISNRNHDFLLPNVTVPFVTYPKWEGGWNWPVKCPGEIKSSRTSCPTIKLSLFPGLVGIHIQDMVIITWYSHKSFKECHPDSISTLFSNIGKIVIFRGKDRGYESTASCNEVFSQYSLFWGFNCLTKS